MNNFQQGSTLTLHRLLSLFVLIVGAAEIVRGHSYPRNVTLPGLGVLTGFYNNHSNVISFLAIPYAKAPIGKLRFQLPEPIFVWNLNRTRNVKQNPPGCMQPLHKPDQSLSEDCLYLNVYSPGNMTDEKADLPVMVWIHGGDFNGGSADTNNVKALAYRGKVILVSFNYRLNIFGFLSSGDKTLPGNAGLHDQVMALKWVKANIQIFGGNPKKVTIFGDSSGAVSIYVLLASSALTDGLFVRAIMQSGMIKSVTDPKDAFKTIAELTSCPHIHSDGKDHGYSTRKQIECMQNKTTHELLSVVSNVYAPIIFGPVIDNVFLYSAIPEQLAARKNIVPCMIGCNNHELVLKDTEKIADMDILKKLLASLGGQSFSPNLVQAILSKFLTNDLDKTYMDAFNSMFLASIQNLTTLISEPRETFMYYFTHHPSFTKPNDYEGARSTDELPFVLGEILTKKSNATLDEKKLSEELIAIWSSFARDGVPQFSNGVKWPYYDKKSRKSVELNLNISVQMNLKESDRLFWNDVIPELKKFFSDPFGYHPRSSGIALGNPEKTVQTLLLSLIIALISVGIFPGL